MIEVNLLENITKEPNWADRSGEKCLVVDLSRPSYSLDQTRTYSQWLQRLPIPTIGVMNKDKRMVDAFDVLTESQEDAEYIASSINRNPVAASVLIQVTRVTSNLPVISALAVESLGYASLQGGSEFLSWLSGQKKAEKVKPRSSAPVLMERNGGGLSIVLNSPDNRNALSTSMREGLSEAFQLVAMDDSIKRVVVSGVGPCFSSGGDLREFGRCKDTAEAHRIRQLKMPGQYIAENAKRYSFNLHGACIGAGIELPAFAEHVSATRDAFFKLPELSMGLIPGAGGCVSIPRRIGRQMTNYIAISGIELSGEQALYLGLVDELLD